jgi:hypothetical protein
MVVEVKIMDNKRINAILESVAKANNTTVENVRKEILIAMDEAQQSTDPLVQARWSKIPRCSEKPTIEEFISYVAQRTMP